MRRINTKTFTKTCFFKFIGIGKEEFPFLNKLDTLTGRLIDNAGFMKVNVITNQWGKSVLDDVYYLHTKHVHKYSYGIIYNAA